MQIRTLLFVIILGAIAALAALNWETFNMPTDLWLGVATVQAPLGVVMLALTALLSAFFLALLIQLQSHSLLESRRHTKELQLQRERADQAEASRFTELRQYVELEMRAIDKQNLELRGTLLDRIERLDTGVTTAIEQSSNTVAAHIGELEDRLERGSSGVTPNRLA
ncbi:MAG: LapA family protein [Herminiimonas sp.]|uniref:LapA family protein n=1 Tax=Herminiimonas sp. TaxID=1926289 RepID=UPI00271E7C0C|nr:LapA family protein [Herminiimonas sp.]MDO9422511.1 LapA family protein [Herminiimonas sp.]